MHGLLIETRDFSDRLLNESVTLPILQSYRLLAYYKLIFVDRKRRLYGHDQVVFSTNIHNNKEKFLNN